MFKSDGKKYLINVEPESFIPNEFYQGVLMVNSNYVGQWASAILPFRQMLLIGRGRIKDIQRSFDYNVINNLGVTMTGNQPGKFNFEIKQIKVVNTDMYNPLELRLKSPVTSVSEFKERFD